MKTDNPFDKKISLFKDLVPNKPEGLVDSAIFVTDTLELCLASAQAVFEEQATPELALEIYDRVVERMLELKHEKEMSLHCPKCDSIANLHYKGRECIGCDKCFTPSSEIICTMCNHTRICHKYTYGDKNPCSISGCKCTNFIE